MVFVEVRSKSTERFRALRRPSTDQGLPHRKTAMAPEGKGGTAV